MGIEIELKLLVAGKYLPRLKEALKQYASGAKVQRRHLVSRYFDTPALQFRDNEVALRVRLVDRQRVQTLKGAGGVDTGIHQRAEWETPAPQGRPDLARFAEAFPEDRLLRRLLRKLPDGGKMQPVFSTDFYRDALLLALPDGSEVEAAIDQGYVLAGGRRKAISELELELKSGNPTAVFDLARRLLTVLPMTIGIASKAERGYALAQRDKPPAPRRARPIKFAASMPVDEAFARIFTECLGQLLGNVEGVIQGRDPEYLHQMRVAIRRFRGALAVFGDVVPKAVFASVASELQAAGQVLGEARNWDVLRHETSPAYVNAANIAISPALEKKLEEASRQVSAKARRLTRSREFTSMLLAIGAYILGRSWRDAATESAAVALSEPVGAFARRAIARRHRRLAKRVATIQPGQPETLHAVRIAAKKLRYSVEFFASLFPAKAVRAHIEALAEIQDLLGRINDAATATLLLRQAAGESPELLAEVAAMEAWLRERSLRDQASFEQTWRRFAKLEAVPK